VEDWYDESFPEYRPGPPWVMEDMLELEPTLPAVIAERRSVAAEIAGLARSAQQSAEPIAVVGCGTSEHGAQAIAAQLSEALGATVGCRQALDAVAAPRPGGLFIAVSHEGETAATIAALVAARKRGARTALVSARSASRGADQADIVLDTTVADRSWCHTVGYLAPILAGGLIAAELDGNSFEADAIAGFLAAVREEGVDVEAVAQADRLVAAGAGVDAVTARELALKVAEGARLPSTALELENVLHGHLVGHDAASALALVATGPAGSIASRRAGQVIAAARRIGLAVGAIGSADVANSLEASLLVRVEAPAEVPSLLARLLGGAIGLQLLTVALARKRGVNPDLLRREEEPYREAARLGEKKTAEVFLEATADA
jgi:glutamine---fructose-6-phosphate transaminase (isomerizing)